MSSESEVPYNWPYRTHDFPHLYGHCCVCVHIIKLQMCKPKFLWIQNSVIKLWTEYATELRLSSAWEVEIQIDLQTASLCFAYDPFIDTFTLYLFHLFLNFKWQNTWFSLLDLHVIPYFSKLKFQLEFCGQLSGSRFILRTPNELTNQSILGGLFSLLNFL